MLHSITISTSGTAVISGRGYGNQTVYSWTLKYDGTTIFSGNPSTYGFIPYDNSIIVLATIPVTAGKVVTLSMPETYSSGNSYLYIDYI